jgi:hypothetical protein
LAIPAKIFLYQPIFEYDLRGFGYSDGKCGHITRFYEYLNDLDQMIHVLKQQLGNRRFYYRMKDTPGQEDDGKQLCTLLEQSRDRETTKPGCKETSGLQHWNPIPLTSIQYDVKSGSPPETTLMS